MNYEKIGSASGIVLAVSKSDKHTFSKDNCSSIKLLKGLGVEGDAHLGKTVKHRSRVASNPNQPNLRQVHLIHSELLDELKDSFNVTAGQMGENITTQGIDLLGLPRDTILYIGETAVIKVTGLRNPCVQIDQFKSGLMKAVLERDKQGHLIRKAGIMSIVMESGEVHPGDPVRIQLPPLPHIPLERV
ncbi:MOSC domain-containing protein [Peribacillus sp. TH16]|uniref:MOSC domain-containing protein n=1 Tax=Peribacillus sp. TH16 TaxID=2798482 RepID=UPI0019128CE5|nr:MOSC domain-containing protein [Peribacillus sp. TH16]MBK5483040.1 MOSC domain-containing protein [Peribacillus sp. TH16]